MERSNVVMGLSVAGCPLLRGTIESSMLKATVGSKVLQLRDL